MVGIHALQRAVARVARLGALLLAVCGACAALGTCELWKLALSSTFPAAATQVTAQRSLTSVISAADASSFIMSDVLTGSREYLVLSSPLTADGVRLIVMDTGLTVLLTLTAKDIAGLGGAPGTMPAKVDTQGNVVVGDMLVANAAGLMLPPAFNLSIATGQGFATSTSGYNIAALTTTPNAFFYIRYNDGTWLQNGWYGGYTILASPTANTSFTIRAVFSDADPARQLALLVLTDASQNLDYYFSIPLNDFATSLIAFPIQTYYPYFTRPATDTNLLGYANGGFIRWVPGGGTSGAFVRTDLGGTDMPTSLTYYNLPDMRTAYSPSGAFYFVFDTGMRTVTRLTAWWN